MSVDTIILIGAAIVLSLFAGFIVGVLYRKKITESKLDSVKTEAKNVGKEANVTAEARSEKILLETDTESIKAKNKVKKDTKNRGNELQRLEMRLLRKDILDMKKNILDTKIENQEKIENREKKEEQSVKNEQPTNTAANADTNTAASTGGAAASRSFAGFFSNILRRNKIDEPKPDYAEAKAENTIEETKVTAEVRHKEILPEAEEENVKTKNEIEKSETEKDTKNRGNILQHTEKQLLLRKTPYKKKEVPDGKIKNQEENADESVKSVMFDEILSWSKLIMFAVLVAIMLNQFLIVNAAIPTGSMENTIMSNDRIIAFRFSYIFNDPARFDIIIFRPPDDETKLYVKRIIGMPGETVIIRDGLVFIDDSETPLQDDFTRDPAHFVGGNYGPFYVPEYSFFVLGDNRGNSEDSRMWNDRFVHRDRILGRAIFRYFRDVGLLH